MKNLVVSFFVFIGILGCANFEFVYEKHPILKNLENNTSLSVSGDKSSVVIAEFYKIFGTPFKTKKFIIVAQSKEKITPLVYDTDGTVSKQEIIHNILYTLKDANADCEILTKEISSRTNFDSASSGYNFSSDLSKQQIIEQNIKKNIDGFFDYLISYEKEIACPDENIS